MGMRVISRYKALVEMRDAMVGYKKSLDAGEPLKRNIAVICAPGLSGKTTFLENDVYPEAKKLGFEVFRLSCDFKTSTRSEVIVMFEIAEWMAKRGYCDTCVFCRPQTI